MPNLNLILAYVANVPKSVALYGSVLGLKPVENSPNFAMFALPNGTLFGLWAAHDIQPPATRPGGVEFAFAVDGADAITKTLSEWQALGLEVVQPPTAMDFGLTATVADSDGHRLRVYAPGAAAVHSQATL